MSRKARGMKDDACPCGSGKSYIACCGPLHDGASASTPEALMRSRYSAYALNLPQYLLASWHSSTRPAELALDPQTRWLGLRVLRSVERSADEGVVEFVARFRVGGASAVRMHETSRFVREEGRWVYLDGEMHDA